MWSRRAFGSLVAAIACSSSLPAAAASPRSIDLSAVPVSVHEQAMRLAIAEARGNPAFPFGAVILRAADRHVMAQWRRPLYMHSGMYALQESVRQMRGTAPAQIPGAKISATASAACSPPPARSPSRTSRREALGFTHGQISGQPGMADHSPNTPTRALLRCN
jgi:hypothetical protein